MHSYRIIFIFLLLLLCVSSVSLWLIKTPDSNDYLTNINAIVVKILKKCYVDSKTIAIHDNSFDFIRHAPDLQPATLIIFQNNSSMTINLSEQQKKVDLFVMTANSNQQLHQILRSFKKSSWWNITIPVFILDGWNAGCNNAFTILKSVWKMNIVTAFFSCFNSNQKLIIYTYNPYTNYAPYPWKETKMTISKQQDRWTLYNQLYHADINCTSMKFDRTKFLDGAVIKIDVAASQTTASIPDKFYDLEHSYKSLMHPFDRHILNALRKALNVTIMVRLHKIDYSDIRWKLYIQKHLESGSSDVLLTFRSKILFSNLTMIYSPLFSGYCIVTQRRGYYIMLQRILYYYEIVTMISLLITLSMTSGVILISGKKRKWSFVGSEILRSLVKRSMYSKIKSASQKLFLLMIFLYFLALHATFQGHSPTWLTKSQNERNVEKLNDLRDSRYSTIYVAEAAKNFIKDPLLKQKMVVVRNPFCSKLVQENSSVACVTDYLGTRLAVIHEDLHMSKNIFGKYQYAYVIRRDWPLRDRLNTLIMTFSEINLIDNISSSEYNERVESITRGTATNTINYHSIKSLDYAFKLLAIGLISATICFVIELIIGRSRLSKKKNVRHRVRKNSFRRVSVNDSPYYTK